MRAFLLGAAIALCWTAPAGATTFYSYEETCPVGGERFPSVGYGSYSTWGARLDGRPYGSSEFPLDVPVCPTNQFVLYKSADEFTPAQVAALTPYVAGDYRALARETSHYRAAHLARVAGEPQSTQAWLMLQAGWQVDADAERLARYQTEFVTLGDAALADVQPTSTEWWMLQFRLANAERQLGRFDAALARIAALPMSQLDDARDGSGNAREGFADGYRRGLDLLRTITEARDSSLEPEAARPQRR